MCSDVGCYTSKWCVEHDVFQDLTLFCVGKPGDEDRPRHQ